MQNTENYSLPYPEGSDIVNLLTILPTLAQEVDSQMKTNQDTGIQRGTHVKSGTVNAITVSTEIADGAFFTFVASDDFTEGDSFTFNGSVIGARTPTGKALKTGAFTINQNVLVCRYGGILTVFTNQADVAVDIELNSLSNNAIANSAVSTTFAEVQQQIGQGDISGVGANIKAAINALNATDGVQNSAIEEVKNLTGSRIGFIDTTNVLYTQSWNNHISYTATENCWCQLGILNSGAGSDAWFIDGTDAQAFSFFSQRSGDVAKAMFPLMKGQTVAFNNDRSPANTANITVYKML